MDDWPDDELDKCRVKEDWKYEAQPIQILGRTRHTRQNHHDKIDELTHALNNILSRLEKGGL